MPDCHLFTIRFGRPGSTGGRIRYILLASIMATAGWPIPASALRQRATRKDPEVLHSLAHDIEALNVQEAALEGMAHTMAARVIQQLTMRDAPKPVVIEIDGIAGSGKTTLARMLAEDLRQLGYEVATDAAGALPGLEMFLKDPAWRKEERAGIIQRQQPYDETGFYDWGAIATFRQSIEAFRASQEPEALVTVAHAYDIEQRRYGPRQFRLQKDAVVILEGPYVSRGAMADIRYRIVNARAKTLYMDRTRRLSPDDFENRDIFYDSAIMPTFERYAREHAADYLIDLSSANPAAWGVTAVGAVSPGEDLTSAIETFDTVSRSP